MTRGPCRRLRKQWLGWARDVQVTWQTQRKPGQIILITQTRGGPVGIRHGTRDPRVIWFSMSFNQGNQLLEGSGGVGQLERRWCHGSLSI